jgi:hypothetical protein
MPLKFDRDPPIVGKPIHGAKDGRVIGIERPRLAEVDVGVRISPIDRERVHQSAYLTFHDLVNLRNMLPENDLEYG